MKVAIDIDNYKTKFLGGARQYLFFAMFTFPSSIAVPSSGIQSLMSSALSPLGYGSQTNIIPYLVKSSSIPDSSFEEIQIPYPGISYKMAGTRTYGDWTVSFNVDEAGTLMKNFHAWHDLIHSAMENKSSSPRSYMKDQQLFLLDGNGNTTQTIQLYSAWPKALGAVGLDYSSTDIATMDVTFAYQYYKISPEPLNSASQQILQSLLNKITGSSLGGIF